MISAEEYKRMRSKLDETLRGKTLTPMQSVQYELLKKWIDGGDFGLITPTMLPRGGLASIPELNKSYLSVAIFQLVSRYCRLTFPY